MKGFLKLSLASAILLFAISCGNDDEATPPHEVGDWELDSFFLTNSPAGYQANEGRTFGIGDITFGGVQFESYSLTVNSNGKFIRKVGIVNSPNINDSGDWAVNDDELELTTEDGDETFTIEKNELDQLWLSQEATFSLIKDAVLDTITDAWVNSLTDEEFNNLFDPVSLDLVYAFERK